MKGCTPIVLNTYHLILLHPIASDPTDMMLSETGGSLTVLAVTKDGVTVKYDDQSVRTLKPDELNVLEMKVRGLSWLPGRNNKRKGWVHILGARTWYQICAKDTLLGHKHTYSSFKF